MWIEEKNPGSRKKGRRYDFDTVDDAYEWLRRVGARQKKSKRADDRSYPIYPDFVFHPDGGEDWLDGPVECYEHLRIAIVQNFVREYERAVRAAKKAPDSDSASEKVKSLDRCLYSRGFAQISPTDPDTLKWYVERDLEKWKNDPKLRWHYNRMS